MQETFRKVFLPGIGQDKAPMLYTKTVNKSLKSIPEGKMVNIYEVTTEVDGILTREKFLKTIDKTNFGLGIQGDGSVVF